GELGDRGVVGGRAVEGRGDDLTLDCPLHVGDLLGTLVNQDDHEVGLGVVGRDGVGDGLQDQRLAGLGRADDQTTLALADRGDEVDQPGREDVRLGLQPQSLLRVERGELGEVDAVAGLLRRQPVDGVQANERVELLTGRDLLAFAQYADGTGDCVPLAQAVLLDDAQRHVDVVLAGQVAAGAQESVVVQHLEDASHRDEHVVLVNALDDLALTLALATESLTLTTTTLAVATALTVASATAGRVVILVVPATTVVLSALLAVVLLPDVLLAAVLMPVLLLAALLAVVLLAVVLLAALLAVVLLPVVLSALALASVLSTALLPVRPVVLTRWASLVPRNVLAGSVLGDRDLHRSLVSNG